MVDVIFAEIPGWLIGFLLLLVVLLLIIGVKIGPALFAGVGGLGGILS